MYAPRCVRPPLRWVRQGALDAQCVVAVVVALRPTCGFALRDSPLSWHTRVHAPPYETRRRSRRAYGDVWPTCRLERSVGAYTRCPTLDLVEAEGAHARRALDGAGGAGRVLRSARVWGLNPSFERRSQREARTPSRKDLTGGRRPWTGRPLERSAPWKGPLCLRRWRVV